MARFFSPFYSLTSYSEWAVASWKKTLLWLLVFTIFIGTLSTFQWYSYWQNELRDSLRNEAAAIYDQYPRDLVLKWDGQRLSSSQAIYRSWPDSLASAKTALETQTLTSAPATWLSLDATATPAAQPASLLQFSSDSVVVALHPDAPFTFPLSVVLSDVEPSDITYESRAQLQPILNQLIDENLTLMSVQLPIAASLIQIIVTLWLSLTNAVVIYFLTRVFGRKHRFSSLLKLSLIVTTVSLTLFALASLVVPATEYWWHELSYWVIMTLVLWQLKPAD